MLEAIVRWLVGTVGALGYPGIVVLMALESSFFPFPSEVVMIPAGYLASRGAMDFSAAVFFGIVGSLIGAWVNYVLAKQLGRRALLKWGHKLFHIPEKQLERAERYFERHGEISTFVGRLIPVVRQYISFPAGIARMNPWKFSFYTAFGAGIWMVVLTGIGYEVGENETLVREWTKDATGMLLVLCILLVLVYIIFHQRNG